jgi:hypothetical protein
MLAYCKRILESVEKRNYKSIIGGYRTLLVMNSVNPLLIPLRYLNHVYTPPKLKYARRQSRGDRQGREYQTRLVSHLALRRESRREDEALGEATIESKTTAKKRTMELELRSRARLGADVGELVRPLKCPCSSCCCDLLPL